MPVSPHHHVQRASREMIAVSRGSTATHAHLRNRLLTILWVTVVLAVVFTLVVFFVERHGQGTQIHNIGDAFLYSTSQLVTASSVATPATTWGKILQLVLDVYAIFVVATLAGSFGAFFHRRSQEQDRAKRAQSRRTAARRTKR